MKELGLRIVEYVNENEESELTVRDDYSGRGMFGKHCLGVVGSRPDLNDLLNHVPGSNEGLCKDNMGLDYIYYWPSISVNK